MADSPLFNLINLATNEVVNIRRNKFTVGRSLKADYVLEGPSISRMHFRIEKNREIWTICDISTNGTVVNNNLLKSTTISLQSGDVISFLEGGISLRFDIPLKTTDSQPGQAAASDSTAVSERVPINVSIDHNYDERREEPSVIDLTSPGPSSQLRRKRRNDSPVAGGPAKKISIESEEEPKTQETEDNSELECSICQELFIKASTLNCSHTFCTFCITRWRQQRNHCPMCRTEIQSVNPTNVLDKLVKKIVDSMDEKSKEEREKTVKDRSEAEASYNPETDPAIYTPPMDFSTDSNASDNSDDDLDISPDWYFDNPPDFDEEDDYDHDPWFDSDSSSFADHDDMLCLF